MRTSNGVRLRPSQRCDQDLTAASYIAAFGAEHMHSGRELGVLCIGTDRSTGDSLGPLVGTFLSNQSSFCGRAWGTLEEPVHAVNLERWIEEYSPLVQRQTLLIAVDASLGQTENIGTVLVSPGPLWPGSGLNKTLPPLGHVSVTGTVNVGGFMEFTVLQNTRLSLVYRLAQTISSALVVASGVLSSPEFLEKVDNLLVAHLGKGTEESTNSPENLWNFQADDLIHARAKLVQGLLRSNRHSQGDAGCLGFSERFEGRTHSEAGRYAVVD